MENISATLIETLKNDPLDMTNINCQSQALVFLEDEPEIYSINDLKKRYV